MSWVYFEPFVVVDQFWCWEFIVHAPGYLLGNLLSHIWTGTIDRDGRRSIRIRSWVQTKTVECPIDHQPTECFNVPCADSRPSDLTAASVDVVYCLLSDGWSKLCIQTTTGYPSLVTFWEKRHISFSQNLTLFTFDAAAAKQQLSPLTGD